MSDTRTNGHVYRVDTFRVPERSRAEFLRSTEPTRNLLRTLSGVVQEVVLEAPSGAGEYRVMTLVEFSSEAQFENAKAAVHALHERTGFRPADVLERLGVTMDRTDYAHAG